MNTKRFDATDKEYGDGAESFIRDYFERNGYSVIHHPNGIYKHDLLFKTSHERFYVEVERAGPRRWIAGTVFPFDTVNVPARRQITDDRLFFSVRVDLKASLVIFPDDLKRIVPVKLNNRHVTSELFRQCPIERCLQLDLESPIAHSISEMNAERVFCAVNSLTLSYRQKMAVLKGRNGELGCPYGLVADQWRNLILKVESAHGLYRQVNKPMKYRQQFLFD